MTSFNCRVCKKAYKSSVVDDKGFSKEVYAIIMKQCLKLGDK